MAATRRTLMTFAGWATMLAVGVIVQRVTADEVPGALRPFANPAGAVRTSTTRQSFDGDNPFFQDLGTNGRSCVSCHQPSDAWTITPTHVRARFDESDGTDPIFANNDGSNCEGAQPDSAADKRAAYSLLLTRGLIRIGLDVPADAEFVIETVDDPSRCAPATNDISVYRRPLPTTNLRFLSAVLWDGRESLLDAFPICSLAYGCARGRGGRPCVYAHRAAVLPRARAGAQAPRSRAGTSSG